MRKISGVLCFLFFFTSVFAVAAETIGMIVQIEGQVEVMHKRDLPKEKAKLGFIIVKGDQIFTAAGSSAKVQFVDKNILVLTANSHLRIDEYKMKENQVELDLIEGQVRSQVEKIYNEEKSFYRVRTQSSVTGVRGTDYLVSFDKTNKHSRIVTFKGKVAVGLKFNDKNKIENAVEVTDGQEVSVQVTGQMGQPRPMLAQILTKLDKETSRESQLSSEDAQKKLNEALGAKKETESKDPKAAKGRR